MRKRTVAITTIPLLITGAAAMAYVSDTFNVVGTGKTSTYKTVTGAVTGVPTDFAPGQQATIGVAVHNPNNFAVTFNSPTITVGDITGCPSGSFTITDAGTVVAPPGDSTPITAHLNFVNLPDAQQSGCLGQPLIVTVAAT